MKKKHISIYQVGGSRRLTTRDKKEVLGAMELLCILTVVVVAQLYIERWAKVVLHRCVHETQLTYSYIIVYSWIIHFPIWTTIVLLLSIPLSVKIHRTVHQEGVNFPACKLYLNQPDFNERIYMKYLFQLPLNFSNRKACCTTWIPDGIVTCRKSWMMVYSTIKTKWLPEFTMKFFLFFKNN